jgi:hypothetical protein
MCWFLSGILHPVRDVSGKAAKMGESAKTPIKTALKREFQGRKLVAGVGFEPTAFRL